MHHQKHNILILYRLTDYTVQIKLFFSQVNISSWATETQKFHPHVHIIHRESGFNKIYHFSIPLPGAERWRLPSVIIVQHVIPASVCVTLPHSLITKQPTDTLDRMPNKPPDLCRTERTSGLRSSTHLYSDSLISHHLHHAWYKLAQTFKGIRKARYWTLFRETLRYSCICEQNVPFQHFLYHQRTWSERYCACLQFT